MSANYLRQLTDEVLALQADVALLERDQPDHPGLKAKQERLRVAYLELGALKYGGPDAVKPR